MNISLADKVAVITGGSRGIGAATVKLFAAAGANVVFSYQRDAKSAKEVTQACQTLPGSVTAERADASKMADARKLISETIHRFGRLDILVANAGTWNSEPLPIDRISERQWDGMININLKGAYSIVHHAVPHMIARRKGRIILISSTAGQRGEAFHTHYGAAKGGVISLVKGLSAELAPHKILVNAVAPGWVDTDMVAPVLKKSVEARRILRKIPLHRLARPDEIAMPILFLASEMSTYLTGEIININGGSVLCG